MPERDGHRGSKEAVKALFELSCCPVRAVTKLAGQYRPWRGVINRRRESRLCALLHSAVWPRARECSVYIRIVVSPMLANRS